MTDSEAKEFCESNLRRLGELLMRREEIGNDLSKGDEWKAIMYEISDIHYEVDAKLVYSGYKPEDASVARLMDELKEKSYRAFRSYFHTR